MCFVWAVVKVWQISRTIKIKINLYNSDMSWLMTSLNRMLAYLFLSKVATLMAESEHKAIHAQPYFHMCISVSQLVRNIGIAVFADIAVFTGIAVFALLQHLNVITSSLAVEEKWKTCIKCEQIGGVSPRQISTFLTCLMLLYTTHACYILLLLLTTHVH